MVILNILIKIIDTFQIKLMTFWNIFSDNKLILIEQ